MSDGQRLHRNVFFVSDGTAITAETLGHSILAQFPNVDFEVFTVPYVDSEEAAMRVVSKINRCAAQDGDLPLVFDTLVDKNLRDIINTANAVNLDVFEGIIAKLEGELCVPATDVVGQTYAVTDTENYKSRIDAVHFALDNDDGARTRHYDKADLILIGVSRSGKTPTSIYLALQFGIRVANYPITEEDLDESVLPAVLRPFKSKIFGLTIDADRLVAIRTERQSGSRYASYSQCQKELRAVQGLYIGEGIQHIDVSEMSIEEISTRILQATGLKRRIS